MNAELPATIPAYLAHLRRALQGADPAMIQDALYDAEEYLRAELAASPGKSEAEVIADVAGSYGAPDEVADIYRETEATVQAALRTPRPTQPAPARREIAAAVAERPANAVGVKPPLSWVRSVFGVFTDPHTYGALFYMLLSLATGIFFFTWTVTGMSLSAGLLILIVGLPFFVLFVGASRVLALVEGRIVEVMLGERMPRRPLYPATELPLLSRISRMFSDLRTWSTLLYFLLMLPLGIAYFSVAVTGLSLALGLMFGPVVGFFRHDTSVLQMGNVDVVASYPWATPLVMLAGFLTLVLTLHVARVIGRLHGLLAKQLLVRG